MKIGIASDHKGYEKKQKLIKYLSKKYEVIDYGTDSNRSVDYPVYAFKLGESINKNEINIGILICYTGIGMSIAANKIDNIVCAKVDNIKEAKMSRAHNNANIISLSARKPLYELKDILDVFFKTSFSNEERHIKRLQMITEYKNANKNEIEMPTAEENG